MMNFVDFKELCMRRRSVRFLDEKPVTREQILDLLSVAILAPNVENLQPWHFHVMLNKNLRRKMVEHCCYGNFVEGAGVFIVVTADRSRESAAPKPVWNPRELEYSCMAAMENILLGATAMGLGGSWVSLHHGGAHEIMELRPTEIIVGGLLIGHVHNDGAQQSGPHEHKRKPLEEVVTLHE